MTHTKCLMIAACGLIACAAQSISYGQAGPSNRLLHPVIVHAPGPGPAGSPSLDAFLAWDAVVKTETVTNGTPQAQFTFALTNISPGVVTINSVVTSCGCTVAKLPEQPWKLAPGTNGVIHVTMNVAGRMGTVAKSVTVNSDKGSKGLIVKTTILPPPAAPATTAVGHQSAPGGVAAPPANQAR